MMSGYMRIDTNYLPHTVRISLFLRGTDTVRKTPALRSIAAQQQLFSFLWWGSRSRSFAAATEATSSRHQQVSSINQTSAAS